MTEAHPGAMNDSRESRSRWILYAPGVLALFPYLAYHGLFARLFWFGDDIDQVDLIDRIGLWRWMWTFYGENFVPLFKLFWGSCVFSFHGSYDAMIAVIWLNHALNVTLLGRLMRTCSFSWTAVLFAQVVFGITSTTIENLAFSVEWAVVLSATFMLLALIGVFRSPFSRLSIAWVSASALAFVKGVLTGPLTAFASFWQAGSDPKQRLGRRFVFAALYLLPSIAVGGLIAMFVDANHRHMAGHGAEATLYGIWYYCLNPLFCLFAVKSWGWHTVVVLGLIKIALISWATLRSRGNQRALFIVFVLFDLGNAVLLGVGRYNFGLKMAVSSRYQYASLIGFLPFAAFGLSYALARLPVLPAIRNLFFSALLASIVFLFCRQWRVEITQWSGWRGVEPRRILLVESAPGPYSVPGFPGFPTQRAKELIAKYNLH